MPDGHRPTHDRGPELALLGELSQWAQRVLLEGMDQDRLRSVVQATIPERAVVPGYDVHGFAVRFVGVLGGDLIDWVAGEGTLTVTVTVTVTVAVVLGNGPAAGILAAGLRGALRARQQQTLQEAIAGATAQCTADFAAANSCAAVFQGQLDLVSGQVAYIGVRSRMVLHVRADGSTSVQRSLTLRLGVHAHRYSPQLHHIRLLPRESILIATAGAFSPADPAAEPSEVLASLLLEADDLAAFEQAVPERART